MTYLDRTHRRRAPLRCALGLIALTGCSAGVTEPLPGPAARAPAPVASSNRPEGPYAPAGAASAADAAPPEISWETRRDEKYARFLREHSGGLIRKAAVGIEKDGVLRVEVSKAVTPEDTLPLTRSLIAGAREDFPDKPILLTVYDPQGGAVVRARYRPGEGVRYMLAEDPAVAPASAGDTASSSSRPETNQGTRGGVTRRDREFADWAEKAGHSMLRYVEADLERHGRLWFGVTGVVKPDDVRPLTKSLLEGARKEFGGRTVSATVFDPEGGRIGRASLDGSGEVRWER